MLAFNFARRKPVIRANIDALPLPSPTSLLCGLDYRALDASRFRLFIPRNLPLLPFSSFFFTLKRRKTRAYSFTRVTNRWPFKLVVEFLAPRCVGDTESYRTVLWKIVIIKRVEIVRYVLLEISSLSHTYFPRSLHPLRPIITYLDHSYHPESI